MRKQAIIEKRENMHKLNSLNPIISFAGFVKTNEDWRREPAYSLCSCLYFVTEGEGVITSDNSSMRLLPGHVYLMPVGIRRGFFSDNSVTKLFFHVNLPIDEQGTDAFESVGKFLSMPYPIEKTEELSALYFADSPLGHLKVKAELLSVISSFLEMSRDTVGESAPVGGTVHDAVRYIRTHLSASLTVSEVADAIRCSRSKLHSDFRRELSRSASDYIEELVMSEAENMLLWNATMSVGEVADKLGFCDRFYFTRRFKAHFGMSPKEYKENANLVKTNPDNN